MREYGLADDNDFGEKSPQPLEDQAELVTSGGGIRVGAVSFSPLEFRLPGGAMVLTWIVARALTWLNRIYPARRVPRKIGTSASF